MQNPINYIVFDFETGGLFEDKNPVLEIALVVLDSNLKEKMIYENYIKPYQNLVVDPGALKANGIQMQEVYEKGVDVKEIYKNLVNIFKENKTGKYQKPILVGHNIVDFDIKFMEYIFNLFESADKGKSSLYKYVDSYLFDTLKHSRMKWGDLDILPNFQLGTVCQHLNIQLIDAHRALNDTQANAKLFISFMNDIRNNSTTTNNKIVKNFRETFQF